MEKSYYYVSFKWDEMVFCSNIAFVVSMEEVEEYYSKHYGWCSVRNVQAGELEMAKRKGMPIVEL